MTPACLYNIYIILDYADNWGFAYVGAILEVFYEFKTWPLFDLCYCGALYNMYNIVKIMYYYEYQQHCQHVTTAYWTPKNDYDLYSVKPLI